jgi:hypothetical protein
MSEREFKNIKFNEMYKLFQEEMKTKWNEAKDIVHGTTTDYPSQEIDPLCITEKYKYTEYVEQDGSNLHEIANEIREIKESLSGKDVNFIKVSQDEEVDGWGDDEGLYIDKVDIRYSIAHTTLNDFEDVVNLKSYPVNTAFKLFIYRYMGNTDYFMDSLFTCKLLTGYKEGKIDLSMLKYMLDGKCEL